MDIKKLTAVIVESIAAVVGTQVMPDFTELFKSIVHIIITFIIDIICKYTYIYMYRLYVQLFVW